MSGRRHQWRAAGLDLGPRVPKGVSTIAEIVRETEASQLLGVSLITLRRWRERGTGPRYVQSAPGRVKYTKAALLDWQRSEVARLRAGEPRRRGRGSPAASDAAA